MRPISIKILLAWLLGALAVVATTAGVVMAQLNTALPPYVSAAVSPAPAIITGTVAYGDTLTGGLDALSENQVLMVQLLDITRADGSELVLGEQIIEIADNPLPFQFEIRYDPAAMTPKGVYGVAAIITVAGSRLFQSATTPLTMGQDHPIRVTVTLARSGPSPSLALPLGIERLAQFEH